MGEVLLGFANHAAAGWMMWFAAATVLGISDNKRDLRHRIEALMDVARGRRTWWMLGLAAFVVLSITGLTKAPAEEAKKDAAQTTAATPATVTVKGIVVDDLGKPIPDARCYLSIGEVNDREVRKSTSDAEGRFRFESVPGATELSLRARHSDFMDSSPLTQEFMGDEPKEHRIILPRATGWLTGVVTRKKDGTPVKNASVYVAQDTTLPLPMLMSFSHGGAKTDEAGLYRILKKSNDNTEGVTIVDAPGLAILVTKFTWKDGEIITLDHALEPDTEVSGKVVNADGKPVRGASVSLSNRMYMMSRPMSKSRDSDYYSGLSSYWLGKPETDDNGVFTGRGLDPRSFEELRLVAQHPTEGFIRVRLKDWTPGGTLKLERWNTLHGKVTGPNNEALSDARMEFTDHQFERDADGKPIFSVMHKSTSITDKQGRYRADQILPHSNSTMVRVNGKFAPPQMIPLGAGETKEFDISFAPKDAPLPQKPLQLSKGNGPSHPALEFSRRLATATRSACLSDSWATEAPPA